MPTLGQRLREIIGDSFGADIVEQNLEKALREARERAAEPRTTFYDPLSLFMGREWLTKRNQPLSYLELRAMARNPIIGSIVQTRMNQVAAFCTQPQDAYDYGFRIKPKDPNKKGNQTKIRELANWVLDCGIPGYGEPNLETFARKFIRDSLILDQACAEIVPAKNEGPAYVVAIDAATIRRLKASLDYATPPGENVPMYVQIIEDKIMTKYTSSQMIFGVRNPQTELAYAGYGMSELELLIRTVTAILNTEKMNTSMLTQGGTSRGILVVKGDANQIQMDTFKRDFREAIRNAASYWRPPVLQVSKEADVTWTELDRSNRDMEYAQLFDFLVKQACGVYQIDPIEINWQIGATGQTTTFEAKNQDKVNSSQQRGLKPLLIFLANQLNSNVIDRLDENYKLEFSGLGRTRAEDVLVKIQEVRTYRTVNEIREELGLEPIKGGELPLDQLIHMKNAPPPPAGGAPGTPPPGAEGDLPVEGADVELTAEVDRILAELETGGE